MSQKMSLIKKKVVLVVRQCMIIASITLDVVKDPMSHCHPLDAI